MKPSENINENKKIKPLQIITLGYAERPKKVISNEQSCQSHIRNTNKENSRFIEHQPLDARQVKLKKPFRCQASNRVPLHMIVSKTASRKRGITPSGSNDQCEESIHPVDRFFKSIKDPNKYKLEPLPSETRPCKNPRGRPNKVDEIVNLMKEKCAQMEPSLHRSQPFVKSGNDPELRNIVFSVLSKKSNSSRRDNFDDINYNNYKALYETTRPLRKQVLDEDPFGSEPGNNSQTPFDDLPVTSSSAKDIGTQTDFFNWRTSRETQTQQQETVNYKEHTHYNQDGYSSPRRIDTTLDSLSSFSVSPVAHNYHDPTHYSQDGSPSRHRSDTTLDSLHSFSESPVAHNYQDPILYSHAGSSTPFRIDNGSEIRSRFVTPTSPNRQNHYHYRQPNSSSTLPTPFFRFEPHLASQKHRRQASNFQDDFTDHQAGSAFATSTPFRGPSRFRPSLGTPRSPAPWDSSSTSSGQTISEERLQVTIYARRKEE